MSMLNKFQSIFLPNNSIVTQPIQYHIIIFRVYGLKKSIREYIHITVLHVIL